MASHSFPVIIEVEETALGPIMKLLHRTPGVIAFHVDMEGLGKKVKPNGKAGGKKYSRSRNVVDPVLAEVSKRKGGAVTLNQFLELYTAAGGGNAKVAAQRYKTQGLLSRKGDVLTIAPKGAARLKKWRAAQAAEAAVAAAT